MASPADRAALERRIAAGSFFRGLSPESRAALAAIGVAKPFGKGEVLFLEGDRGRGMFLLDRGEVRLSKTTPEGVETVIKAIRPGEAFAEVVLFEEDRYPVTAVGAAEGLAFLFPRDEVHRLLDRRDVRNDFVAMLMRKQRYLAGRIHDLASRGAEERLLDHLRSEYGAEGAVEVPTTKREVAAAIGATPETLSRLLKRLARRGVLAWKGRTLRWGRGRGAREG